MGAVSKTDQQTVRACPSWGAMTPADLLAKLAGQKPDAPFLTQENGDVLSFWQVDAQVDRLAAYFAQHGLKPGDCILLRAGRRPQGLIAILAAARAGLDCCVVPQTMSAREASHGSRVFLPKAVIDAGMLDPDDGLSTIRVMEIAANLFTARFVAGFQGVCDGMVDLDDDLLLEAQADDAAHFEPVRRSTKTPWMLHTLRAGPTGRIDRLSRSSSVVLTQGLANAMNLRLNVRSVMGVPFDPASMTGFLCAVVPSLIAGGRFELFNALDPLVADHLTYWADQDRHHCALLPYALHAPRKADEVADVLGRIAWIAQAVSERVSPDLNVLVDLGGFGFVAGTPNARRDLSVAPGTIIAANAKGGAMEFGTLGLAEAEDTRQHGKASKAFALTLEGPLAASSELSKRSGGHTGIFASPTESPLGEPCYTLAAHDPLHGPLVSGQPVMMATINRSLSLTGRWEDAAAFAVPDPVLGNRIEVAIEPRKDEDGEKLAGALPTLEAVRAMLSESGIGDAGLPSRLHLVQDIPRSATGQVIVDQLEPYEPPAEPDDADDDTQETAGASVAAE